MVFLFFKKKLNSIYIYIYLGTCPSHQNPSPLPPAPPRTKNPSPVLSAFTQENSFHFLRHHHFFPLSPASHQNPRLSLASQIIHCEHPFRITEAPSIFCYHSLGSWVPLKQPAKSWRIRQSLVKWENRFFLFDKIYNLFIQLEGFSLTLCFFFNLCEDLFFSNNFSNRIRAQFGWWLLCLYFQFLLFSSLAAMWALSVAFLFCVCLNS